MKTSMFQNRNAGRETERGIALVTVLVFLVMLTLIGVMAMQSSGLQERMAGNLRDQEVSFQATESAVREGEVWVNALTVMPAQAAANCPVGGPCNVVWPRNSAFINGGNFLDPNFWNNSPNTRVAVPIPGVTGGQTKYVIEFFGTRLDSTGSIVLPYDTAGTQVFRITARGPGLTPNSISVIQTTYGKRFD